MPKDDQQEAFERALLGTLGRVVDNLKFAETKNAALLTFSSAWILASINLISGSSKVPHEFQAGLIISLAPLIFAALTAIRSFLPRLDLWKLHWDPIGDKSLMYFGDIATFSPAAFKQRLAERYMPPENSSATQGYLDDLSIQIAINSAITTRKFKLFRVGALLVTLAVVTDLLVPALLYVNKALQLEWRWASWLSKILN